MKSFTHIFFATGRMGRACDDFYFRFEAERLDTAPGVDLETAIKLLYSCSLHGICPSDHTLGICEAAILDKAWEAECDEKKKKSVGTALGS